MKTYNVINGTSTADIQSIIAEASSGDTILFEDGTYFEDNGADALSLLNADFDENNPLTIASQDGSKVVFDGDTSIVNSSGIIFDGIVFQDRIDPSRGTENVNESAVLIRSSQNIEIQDSVVKGTLLQPSDEVKEDNYHSKYDGYYVGYGVSILGGDEDYSRNIAIENSEITELGSGIILDGAEEVSIQGNAIYKIREDGIRGRDHDSTEIIENYFTEFRPWRADINNPNGNDEHGDMIQYWTDPVGTGISDFTIKGNIFFDASSTFSDNDEDLEHVQVIQGSESLGAKVPNDGNDFTNFIIEDNLIYGGQRNAIKIHGVNGGSIKNNTLIPNAEVPDKNQFVPLISIHGWSTDLDISENVSLITPNVKIDEEIVIDKSAQDYNATVSSSIQVGDNYGYYVQDYADLFTGLGEAYDSGRDVTLDDLLLTDAKGLVDESFGSSLANIDNLESYIREKYFEGNGNTEADSQDPITSISFGNANERGDVLGTTGADVMQANANSSSEQLRGLGRDGNDTLIGANNVALSGEKGDDLLILNGGDSFVWGGSGSDTFKITSETESGSNILDFEQGIDIIVFEDVRGIGSMSDLTITPLNRTYTSDSLINFGEEQIRVKDIMVEDFSNGDFDFL